MNDEWDDWEGWHERASDDRFRTLMDLQEQELRVRARKAEVARVRRLIEPLLKAPEPEVIDRGMGQNVACAPATVHVNVATVGQRVDL